jgi:4,5-DOPA dioxygenase extradiol
MNELKSLQNEPSSERMPIIFVGHGSPMNAIEQNSFTNSWRTLANSIPKPNAILCISAHWETNGTKVTSMEVPRTIHDFYGFPKALFDVQYPAPGSLAYAEETKKIITKSIVEMDHTWGFDHGCWSVLMHMYPNADIPVLQLSLDEHKNPKDHFELAQELNQLRNKGVLIIGSGNIVHNLGMMNWNKSNEGYDWAISANEKIKSIIQENEIPKLFDYTSLGRDVQMAVPSPEHFLPLIYTLASKTQNEEVEFFNDHEIYGSISMTGLTIR